MVEVEEEDGRMLIVLLVQYLDSYPNLSLLSYRSRALTRILRTGVPEPFLPKSGSPTIQ